MLVPTGVSTYDRIMAASTAQCRSCGQNVWVEEYTGRPIPHSFGGGWCLGVSSAKDPAQGRVNQAGAQTDQALRRDSSTPERAATKKRAPRQSSVRRRQSRDPVMTEGSAPLPGRGLRSDEDHQRGIDDRRRRQRKQQQRLNALAADPQYMAELVEELRERYAERLNKRRRQERQTLSTKCPLCGRVVGVDENAVVLRAHQGRRGSGRCNGSDRYAGDLLTDEMLAAAGLTRSRARERYRRHLALQSFYVPPPGGRGGWTVSGGLPTLGRES